MTKVRIIPFGYQMKNGKMLIQPDEAEAVQEIFREYLSGKTLQQIMNGMLIPYQNGIAWNVSHIRTILQNTVYSGTEIYPMLIEPEIFKSVQKLRHSKAHLNKVSEEVKAVRDLAVCSVCGEKLLRYGGVKKREYWYCRHMECGRPPVRITDEMLLAKVTAVLNIAIENSDLTNSNVPETNYSPSQEVIRQQNEIRRMMENSTDYERIKSEIFKLAELKYSCCEYSDIPQKTKELKYILSQTEKQNMLNAGLLRSCVRRILVSRFCTIEIEFINGVTINERGEIT